MLQISPPVRYDPRQLLTLLQMAERVLLSAVIPREQTAKQVLCHQERVVDLLCLLHLLDCFSVQLLGGIDFVVGGVEEAEEDQEAVEVLRLVHFVVSEAEAEPEGGALLGDRLLGVGRLGDQLLQMVLVDVCDYFAYVPGCDTIVVPLLPLLP